MDELKTQKLQAMKEYKKNQFLHKLFIYFFAFLAFTLFCSSPHWVPSLISALNVFYLVHLPNMWALVFNPKCLFIVCNIIVAFLVGESKLMSLKSSSPPSDIYEEFVSRSGSLRRVPSQAQKKEKELKLESFVIKGNHDEKKVVAGEEKKGEQECSDDQEEELGLPAEELHKRAEDLIARVNKQRKMEAALY